MTELPEVPDEFDSEEQFREYLDQLREHVDSLEELEDSEKDKLEAYEELEEIKEEASQADRASDGFASIIASLEAMQDRIEQFDEEYLAEDSDYGLPDGSEGAEALSEALGVDITQDPEEFKKELEEK